MTPQQLKQSCQLAIKRQSEVARSMNRLITISTKFRRTQTEGDTTQ